MAPKLLFVFGIVLAHGALAAAWVQREAPTTRDTVASCVNSPLPMPYFQPRRELLAAHVVERHDGDHAQP